MSCPRTGYFGGRFLLRRIKVDANLCMEYATKLEETLGVVAQIMVLTYRDRRRIQDVASIVGMSTKNVQRILSRYRFKDDS